MLLALPITHTIVGVCNVLLAPVCVCQRCCNQDRHQLEALAAKLSAELAKQQQHAAASANHSGSSLLDVQVLQVELEELLQGHADHLRAAASFPTSLVTQALEVSLPHHCAHHFEVLATTADRTDELPSVAAYLCFPMPFLQAHTEASNSLHSRVHGLSGFISAQQAWDQQLELLYSTSAVSTAAGQHLQGLQAAGESLLNAAGTLEVSWCL